MFFYYLYERKVISDLLLFNIPLSNTIYSSPDIVIHHGDINEKYRSAKPGIYTGQNFGLVKATYGTISITGGNEIIYEINKGFDAESITPYIMGWATAIVLTQSGHSAFHCSALERNNQCFFVSGISGAGKSTTALELIKHGCKYLCDDIAIVESYEDMLISPAYPIQKVCTDISSKLDADKLYSISNDRGKSSYLNISDYCNTPKRLKTLFKLEFNDGDHVEIREITGINKFKRLLECLFLGIIYAYSDIPESEKFRCLKIAGNIRLFTISRPKNINTLNEITDNILRILDEQENY
ncbi:MAG: hypothetical protein IKN95_00990 [Lachnospiraceae bacterium]|nr:hypothetical protein [Lachnospiraceae bacterium]